MQVLFCDLLLYEVAEENIGRVSRLTDFVGRLCRATKPRPQKSVEFVVRLTSPLHFAHIYNSKNSSKIVTGLIAEGFNIADIYISKFSTKTYNFHTHEQINL